MMYLELFIKKYKEAILINLDVCMKQALQTLEAGSWECIRSLKLDTYNSNLEQTEKAKASIKKIFELQKIDFAEFATHPVEMEGFQGEFLEDLFMEIAKADAINREDPSMKTRNWKEGRRMLCNETLDLSIMNVNDGIQNGLTSMLDSSKKKPAPVPKLASTPDEVNKKSEKRPEGIKRAGPFFSVDSPRRKTLAGVRSAEAKKSKDGCARSANLLSELKKKLNHRPTVVTQSRLCLGRQKSRLTTGIQS